MSSGEVSCYSGTQEKKARSDLLLKLRKERSAQAARQRRNKENVEYDKVKALLPIDEGIAKNLDKASVIRITISFLRMCKFAENGFTDWNLPIDTTQKLRPESTETLSLRKQIALNTLKGLDGFLMVVSTDGKILYISETVNDHLGLNWDELPGSTITDIIPHQEDQHELKSILRQLNGKDINNEEHVNFILRFKSQREKRTGTGNKNKNIIPTKACQIIGHLRYSDVESARGLVCTVIPLISINVRETCLPAASFFVLTDVKFVVTKCDPRVSSFIELEQDDLLDVSLYSMIHPNDIDNVIKAHQQLLSKSQSTTLYYRWLQRKSGYVWCKSTLSLTQRKGDNDDYVLWVNQVISCTSSDVNNGLDLFQMYPADLKVRKNHSSGSAGLDNAFVKTNYQADVFHEANHAPELKYSDNGNAASTASTATTTTRVPTVSPTTPTKMYPAEFSPGSSPEPEPKPEITPMEIHSPNGIRSDTAPAEMIDLGNEDLGKFPGPKNVCVTTFASGTNEPKLTRDSIQNRATLPRSDDSSYKRPRSVLVMPPSLKNEPIAIRNWFKRDGNGDVTSEKFRKTDDHRTTSKNVISKIKLRSKESNLKTSLDEPGPANQTFSNNELDESAMMIRPFVSVENPPKIRLPKAIRSENVLPPETIYQNVVVHHQSEMYQPGEATHVPQAVAYVTTGHHQAQTPQPTIHLQPREISQARDIQTVPIQQLQYAPSISQSSKTVYWVACHKIEEQPNKVEYVKIPDIPVHVAMPGTGKLVPEKSIQETQIAQVAPHSPKFVSVNGSPMSEQTQTVIPLYLPSTSTTANSGFGVVPASYTNQGQMTNQIFPTFVIPATQNQQPQQPQLVAVVQGNFQGAPFIHVPHQLSGQVQSNGAFINA